MDLKKLGLGKRQTPRKGDYYNNNGVLVCGTCGKEREWHGIWPGIGMTWAACICDCDKKKHFADIEAEELAKKKIVAKMHREWAFPHGSNLHLSTLEKDDKMDAKVSKAIGEKCERCWKYRKLTDGICDECKDAIQQ